MSNSSTTVDIRQTPQGRLGMWILIAGELIIFGGLIACYLLNRIRYPEWGMEAVHTSTFFGALNTAVLLLSSFTIVLAHTAANNMKPRKAQMYMMLTIIGGLLFLVNKSIEYSREISEGLTFSSPKLVASGKEVGSLFWSFYYIMTGLHALHVVVGMTVIFIIMLQIRKGNNLHRVELAGMYWHMVDLIWIFLFPLLYIAK